MSFYAINLNKTTDNIGNCTSSIKPSASQGIALTGFSWNGIETAAFGSRIRLFRASADGTGGNNTTPVPYSSRSPASGVTGHDDYTTTDPTLTGLALIVFPIVQGTAMLRQHHWSIPNPRYPVIEEPSGNLLCLDCGSQLITITSRMAFIEAYPGRNTHSTMRGRRTRNPGLWSCRSNSGNFEGLSTAPKNGGCSVGNNYVQPADWPDSVYEGGSQLNLLLSGGLTDEQGSGALASVSSFTASLVVGFNATGVLTSVSSFAGNASYGQYVSSSLVSVSSFSHAALVGFRGVGALASVSSFGHSLLFNQNVNGALASVSSISATQTVGYAATGSLASVSSFASTPRVGYNLTGSLVSVSDFHGDATVSGGSVNYDLTGALASVSSFTANALVGYSVTGSLASVSSMSFSVNLGYASTGTLQAVSNFAISENIGYLVNGSLLAVSAFAGVATTGTGSVPFVRKDNWPKPNLWSPRERAMRRAVKTYGLY